MLENRLRTAYDLYKTCSLAADIGTDHGLLPAALLRSGRCRQMILTDLSEKALSHARGEMERQNLMERVSLRSGNGLEPLHEACDMISILGMGGRTIADILQSGKEKIRNADLLLSAHTDLPQVRQAVMNIGYHLQSETPCCDRGRYYLIFVAQPGPEALTETEIMLGKKLISSSSPALLPYLQHQQQVLRNKISGLKQATHLSGEQIHKTEELLLELSHMIRSVSSGKAEQQV